MQKIIYLLAATSLYLISIIHLSIITLLSAIIMYVWQSNLICKYLLRTLWHILYFHIRDTKATWSWLDLDSVTETMIAFIEIERDTQKETCWCDLCCQVCIYMKIIKLWLISSMCGSVHSLRPCFSHVKQKEVNCLEIN